DDALHGPSLRAVVEPHRYATETLDQRDQIAGPYFRMKGAAAGTPGGPRRTDRNQLGDGTEDLIVANGVIIEPPSCAIGALVAAERHADCRLCRNTPGPRQADRNGGNVGDRRAYIHRGLRNHHIGPVDHPGGLAVIGEDIERMEITVTDCRLRR